MIIEMLANVNLQKDLEIIADHGRIVVSNAIHATCSLSEYDIAQQERERDKNLSIENVNHKLEFQKPSVTFWLVYKNWHNDHGLVA